MKNKAYTLAEVLVALGIIGVAAALCLPLANKLKPDETKMICLRTYDDIQQTILELVNDHNIYPMFINDVNGQPSQVYHALLNTTPDNNSVCATGNKRLCDCLAKAYGKSANNCQNADRTSATKGSEITQNPSISLKNGVDLWITTIAPQNDINKTVPNPRRSIYVTAIIIDTNGKGKGDNCVYNSNTCKNPDQFKFLVDYDGQMIPADGMSKFYIQTRLNPKKEQPENISDTIDNTFEENN